jgi:hypothetical protein
MDQIEFSLTNSILKFLSFPILYSSTALFLSYPFSPSSSLPFLSLLLYLFSTSSLPLLYLLLYLAAARTVFLTETEILESKTFRLKKEASVGTVWSR